MLNLGLRETFRRRRGPLAFLAVVGPGLIAGVAGNDAGGITTYATLGSQTGLRFLWILPLTALLLALVQESVARLGVVTGQGLSDLIRERFGVRWALFAMIVLLLALRSISGKTRRDCEVHQSMARPLLWAGRRSPQRRPTSRAVARNGSPRRRGRGY